MGWVPPGAEWGRAQKGGGWPGSSGVVRAGGMEDRVGLRGGMQAPEEGICASEDIAGNGQG